MPIATQVIGMNKKKSHQCLLSVLKTNEDDLLKFVAQRRDKGIPISSRMVQLEGARINHALCNKSNHAKKSIAGGCQEAMLSNIA